MASDLFTLAENTMQAIVDAFNAANIALPERKYVSNNGVAYDCEQVSVEIGALATGGAVADQPKSLKTPKVPVATLLVALIRDCQPMSSEDGTPPSVEAIETASDELLADATVLIRTFLKKNAVAGCTDLSVQTCVPYGPEGRVAGWVLTLRIVF